MSISKITPYLAVDDARAALTWYQQVFETQIVEGEFYEDGDRIETEPTRAAAARIEGTAGDEVKPTTDQPAA